MDAKKYAQDELVNRLPVRLEKSGPGQMYASAVNESC